VPFIFFSGLVSLFREILVLFFSPSGLALCSPFYLKALDFCRLWPLFFIFSPQRVGDHFSPLFPGAPGFLLVGLRPPRPLFLVNSFPSWGQRASYSPGGNFASFFFFGRPFRLFARVKLFFLDSLFDRRGFPSFSIGRKFSSPFDGACPLARPGFFF